MRYLTQAVVGLLVLALVSGCGTTALTTQQVQNLSYMSGYTTVAIYLVAKKPDVATVVAFQKDIQAIQLVMSASPTAAPNISALIDSFVKQTPTDTSTALLLNAMVPPIVMGINGLIDDYVSTQAAPDQIKTLQLATVCALAGISDACDAYVLAVTQPAQPPAPTPIPTPTSKATPATIALPFPRTPTIVSIAIPRWDFRASLITIPPCRALRPYVPRVA
jgi:hypothetical protein